MKQRGVLVSLDPDQVDYLIDQMLTDDMRIYCSGNIGAATVVRAIVVDAIATHKKQVTALKASLCQPNRARLMAGR